MRVLSRLVPFLPLFVQASERPDYYLKLSDIFCETPNNRVIGSFDWARRKFSLRMMTDAHDRPFAIFDTYKTTEFPLTKTGLKQDLELVQGRQISFPLNSWGQTAEITIKQLNDKESDPANAYDWGVFSRIFSPHTKTIAINEFTGFLKYRDRSEDAYRSAFDLECRIKFNPWLIQRRTRKEEGNDIYHFWWTHTWATGRP